MDWSSYLLKTIFGQLLLILLYNLKDKSRPVWFCTEMVLIWLQEETSEPAEPKTSEMSRKPKPPAQQIRQKLKKESKKKRWDCLRMSVWAKWKVWYCFMTENTTERIFHLFIKLNTKPILQLLSVYLLQ